MEDINKFLGGMNKDVHPINQPEQTIREFVNFIPLTKDGNLYSVTNERGTVLFDNISFPPGFQVIGHDVLNTEIFVILASPQGFSQIGVIKNENDLHPTYGKYHPIAPCDAGGVVPEDNNEFGFIPAFPVDVQSRKLINGHRVLYYTDNKNPVGRVDLDNPPKVGSVAQESKLFFNQKIPKIRISEIRENVSGTIRPGVVQFISRYVTETGGVTSFGIPSNPLPMVPENKNVGPDSYDGAFYEDQIINKNVILSISNVDTQYQELEIVAIYYEGSQSIFKASIVGQVPIVGDTIEFTYTGPDTEAEITLTREELRKVPITYTRAKAIEQKDNTLFLSNLASDRQEDDELLQGIANGVRVKYRIDEVQFSGRGTNGDVQQLGFVASSAVSGSLGNDINVEFTSEVAVADQNDFILHKPGVVATATITIDDSTLITDGLILSIGAGPGQIALDFESESIATGDPDKFLVVSGNDNITAENLAAVISSNPDVLQYSVSLLNNVITLSWNVVDLTSNGVTISSISGVTGTNFAGADATAFTETATAITINGSTVTAEFPSLINSNDELEIVLTESVDGLTYTTGDQNFLPILSEDLFATSTAQDVGFTDYINESLTVNKKGYKRGEVYSFGFCLIYKDGSTSFVYHIPGFNGYVDGTDFSNGTNKFAPTGADQWPSFSQSALSSGCLGTYVSSASYPLDQNYSGNEPGDDAATQGPVGAERNLRHHLMPSIENEPHYRVDGDVTWLRILNLDFEFSQAIPQSVLEEVEEVMFVRERRNTNQNRSILAQGVVNRQVVSADNFEPDGKVDGSQLSGGTSVNNPKDGYYAMEMPFFNNMEALQLTGKNEDKSSGHTRAGVVYPNLSGGRFGGGYSSGERQSSTLFNNRFFFHSPETELLTSFRFNEDNAVSARMTPVLSMIGDYNRVGYKPLEWRSDAGDDFLQKTSYADFIADYKEYETTLNANTSLIERARFADPGVLRLGALDTISEPTLKTGTRWSSGGLEIKTDGDLTAPNTSNFRITLDIDFKDKTSLCISNCTSTRPRGSIFDTTNNRDTQEGLLENALRRYLYDIVLNNEQQYGQLSIASYIPIERRSVLNPDESFNLIHNSIFGGDTFISKYAYNGGQLIHYTGYDRVKDSSQNRPKRTSSNRPTGFGHIDGINRLGSTENLRDWGYDLRWNTYFFVESQINTNYRHRPDDETKQDYYPNNSNYSALLEDYRAYLGNVQAYNTQYSYENNVREFFVKGSTQNVVTAFENRTIYSETASEDDTLDAYRSFLQNNFYDLPQNTGPIWDTFVQYNRLFMHTPKSLWQTFAEPAATIQGGNISDAVLGTGRLFARPSIEMLTTTGGYAGTISQYGGCQTQIGYIFPDILQGKVFLLAVSQGGPHLKELSLNGLQTYMHQNLPDGLISNNGEVDLGLIKTETANEIDNPFLGIGVNGGYDYKLRRYFLVKHGTFTLTYSTITNNWFSFHNYSPNLIIPFDNRVFFYRNQAEGLNQTVDMWEMNLGDHGSYFNEVFDSRLEFVSAFKNNSAKTYQNLKISSDSYEDGVKIRDDNFITLQVHNDRMNTGVLNLVHGNTFYPPSSDNEILLKYRNDEYRLAIPRDSVLDNSGDVFDPANIYINQGGTAPVDIDYGFRERIKGDYAYFTLVYSNINNREFVLNHISTIFNNNVR